MATALIHTTRDLNVASRSLASVAVSGARNPLQRFYHPELDVLRFVAFSLVFVHHHFPATLSLYQAHFGRAIAVVISGLGAGGAFGVDVFFTLSSYIITELLLREKTRAGYVDVKSFYIRRILRIWPLYFFFLALAYALNRPLHQQVSWKAIAAFLFFSGNWYMMLAGKAVSVINPLWSISVEEQFYLAWPPVVRNLSERGLILISCGMLAISNIARLTMGLAHLGSERYFWFNTLTRLDPIALGIILAVMLGGCSPRLSGLSRVLLFVASLSALIAAANSLHVRSDPVSLTGVVFGYPIIAVSSVGLLLSLLTNAVPWYARGPLVYLGRISYGLYVFHLLALKLADIVHTHFRIHPNATVVAFVFTVLFATLSYKTIERPFLRLKEKYCHVLSRPGG